MVATIPSTSPTVEFFFDPVCPWAWVTSRWISEVRDQGLAHVIWSPISLRVINTTNYDDPGFPKHYRDLHMKGHRLLRVAAALGFHEHNNEIGRLYTLLGQEVFIHKTSDNLLDGEALAMWLKEHDFSPELAAAADDESYDPELVAFTDEALTRTGRNVGTPIMTVTTDGARTSFFGPVLGSVPRGAEAKKLWEAYLTLSSFEDLYEIKRAVRQAPKVGS